MKFAASANLYFGYSYFYFYFAKVKAICDAQQRKVLDTDFLLLKTNRIERRRSDHISGRRFYFPSGPEESPTSRFRRNLS